MTAVAADGWDVRLREVVGPFGEEIDSGPPTVGSLARLAWKHRIPAAELLGAAAPGCAPHRVALARAALRRDMHVRWRPLRRWAAGAAAVTVVDGAELEEIAAANGMDGDSLVIHLCALGAVTFPPAPRVSPGADVPRSQPWLRMLAAQLRAARAAQSLTVSALLGLVPALADTRGPRDRSGPAGLWWETPRGCDALPVSAFWSLCAALNVGAVALFARAATPTAVDVPGGLHWIPVSFPAVVADRRAPAALRAWARYGQQHRAHRRALHVDVLPALASCVDLDVRSLALHLRRPTPPPDRVAVPLPLSARLVVPPNGALRRVHVRPGARSTTRCGLEITAQWSSHSGVTTSANSCQRCASPRSRPPFAPGRSERT